MASCLLECLCEAELEQYYPQFLAVGLQKIEELAEVTMKDYSRLGVHSMEDRKRLFQLIKIIQSVASEDDDQKTPLQPGCVYLQPPHNRSATRRQLQFDVSYDGSRNGFLSPDGRQPYPTEETSPAAHRPGHQTSTAGVEETSSSSAEGSSLEGLKSMASGLRSSSDVPIVHRVVHVSGYNYGVPQTPLRPIAADKEEPWTDSDKIRVCVRKRPLGLREERRGEVSVVTVEDGKTVLIHERKEAVNLKEYILQHVFYFDEVFSETFTNQDVYAKTAQPLIQHVLNGENAACFAYGQTGAGKTYTMIGTQKNPGLYALAARDLFQQLETSQPRRDHSVWISFFEIYCGQLYDLLHGRKRLYAREDGKHVVQVVGLREVQVKSVDYLLEMILKGSRERSTGATGVNSDSSRSHAVIQIQIKDAGSRKLGRMSFIDLAGSERASDARESDKQTKIEGAEINQSLLALKECIRALDQEQAHTPFRQSKLTQVLKDSFIGNSKTCMIANISPSHIATEHTLNTLRYADRVKELKKGMRCPLSSATRSRSTPCLSPKRVQNSSSTPGDKVSPKKVKLGSSSPYTTKHKSYPSVFHPSNVPLSSTPKTCPKPSAARGASSQAWLAHTTPIKGIIRTGHSGKNQEKTPTPRIPKPELSHDCVIHTRPRVQAVQPVQKQVIPRGGVAFGESNMRSRDSGDQERREREEHLKCYHQQFQQPPILHQKLHYQPLEKILDPYKPQEVTYGRASREGQTPEDPDDSDFSEDSFSYASNQKKGRKEEMVRERLSFFLHQGSPSADTRKLSGRDEGPRFNDPEARECRAPAVEAKRTEQGLRALWGSEDDSAGAQGSTGIIHTPEKPYSPQEDLAIQGMRKPDPCFRHKTEEGGDVGPMQDKVGRAVGGGQSAPAALSSEESMNRSSDSALMAPLTVSLLQGNWSLDGTHDVEPHASPRSSSGGGNVTFDLTGDSQDVHSVESNLSALVQQMLRYTESLQSCSSQQSQKDLPLEVESQSRSPSFPVEQAMCDQSSSPSLGDSSYDAALSRCGNRVGHCYDADNEESRAKPRSYEFTTQLRPLRTPDGSNRLSDHKAGNKSQEKVYTTSTTPAQCNPPIQSTSCRRETGADAGRAARFTDCELEHIKNKLMKCLFTPRGIKEDKRYPPTRDERGPRNKAALTDQLQPGPGNSPPDSTLEKAQLLLVQAHCTQLKDVSALCLQEEMLLTRASNSDFQEYVMKLDEILLLKCRLIENLRAELQLYLDYSSSSGQEGRPLEASDCLCCS